MIEFVEFPKIPRYSRECIITEKIDGTNGCIYVPSPLDWPNCSDSYERPFFVGSRSRWISPENDNHGFARWAYENKEELIKLGPGRHFGEWWGQEINRGYGLKEKRFSLFNLKKWSDSAVRPACCHVVPIIATGEFGREELIYLSLSWLKGNGSYAAPGFMKPEGIVIYHTAGNLLFKKTLEKDDEWKGKQSEKTNR